MAMVLVADDDPVSRRILSHIIGRSGHEVVSAENGRQALDRLAEHAADLLILDLSMPEVDGLTVLREARADERYRDLPIIMLTASGLDRDARAARAEGVTEFLTKPFRSEALVEMLQRLLGST
ncbi:MAG: response regulator [Chloroflexi bacterium]|nr:response regulator [Chloroflexota bacterium]MBV9546215.1 response regulator [Chloroflexota bacterium]